MISINICIKAAARSLSRLDSTRLDWQLSVNTYVDDCMQSPSIAHKSIVRNKKSSCQTYMSPHFWRARSSDTLTCLSFGLHFIKLHKEQIENNNFSYRQKCRYWKNKDQRMPSWKMCTSQPVGTKTRNNSTKPNQTKPKPKHIQYNFKRIK